MSGPRRVIVGTSGSPGNLCALRHAEHLARAYDAVLIPVHTWTPPAGDIAERRSPCVELRCLWTEDAWQRLWDAIDAAWGQPPPICRSGLWWPAAPPGGSLPSSPATLPTCSSS